MQNDILYDPVTVIFKMKKLHLSDLHIFSHTAKDMFRAINPNQTEKEM